MARERRPNSRESFMAQIESAKISVAKTALANPYVYPEGSRLGNARQAHSAAVQELAQAEAAWKALIAPAKGWAKDPFEEK